MKQCYACGNVFEFDSKIVFEVIAYTTVVDPRRNIVVQPAGDLEHLLMGVHANDC